MDGSFEINSTGSRSDNGSNSLVSSALYKKNDIDEFSVEKTSQKTISGT